jgi:hypothetical protein
MASPFPRFRISGIFIARRRQRTINASEPGEGSPERYGRNDMAGTMWFETKADYAG